MKLYHGTNNAFMPAISVDGIRPRGRKRGNWQHTVTSNPHAVYLTSAYPWHFAAAAVRDGGVGLILEIDPNELNPVLCCPDEDVLEQAQRGRDDVPGDMKARTLYYRRIARFNPQHFDTSLRAMGTAAYYGTVPWSAVTRYATLEFDHMHPQWYMRCVDSVPSILSYRVLGHNHEAFTKWIFGDEVSADELFMMSIDRSPETTAALMNDRRGITVRVNECS